MFGAPVLPQFHSRPPLLSRQHHRYRQSCRRGNGGHCES